MGKKIIERNFLLQHLDIEIYKYLYKYSEQCIFSLSRSLFIV